MTTMIKYVGTKEVLARPMTRGDYNKYQGWTIPADENPDDEGYLVEYLNGGPGKHPDHENYISWSPKNVFEASYKEVDSTIRGLTAEMTYLDESPFLAAPEHYLHDEAWHPFTSLQPTVARATTLFKYREEKGLGNEGLEDQEGFEIRFANKPSAYTEFEPHADFLSKYALIGRKIERSDNAEGSVASNFPMTVYQLVERPDGPPMGVVETLSDVNGKLTFSDALTALKFGYRVQRNGWNAKDQWLAVSNPNKAVVEAADFWSKHTRAYAEQNGGSAVVPPCILIKNAQGEIQMGWLPSPGDLFAQDWVVIEEPREESADVPELELAAESPADEEVEQAPVAALPETANDEVSPLPVSMEHAAKLPYEFTGEQLAELIKSALPAELAELLYYTPSDGFYNYSIGLTGKDVGLVVRNVNPDRISFNGFGDGTPTTWVKQPNTMAELFIKLYEKICPVGE